MEVDHTDSTIMAPYERMNEWMSAMPVTVANGDNVIYASQAFMIQHSSCWIRSSNF